MKILIAILLAIVLAFSIASPVSAAVSQPDATPTLEQMSVFRNLRETGDMLYVFLANIPYSTTPDIPINDAYWWSLRSGATDLGSTGGYAYNSYGYGYNVYSMYFSADDVTALGMVWGTAYELRLNQSPSQFAAPVYFSYSVYAGDYYSETESEVNRQALVDKVLELADILDNVWALSVTYSLLTETDTGMALSIYGSAFFRGAIFSLQSMAPSAFSVMIRNIEIEDRVWDEEYAVDLSEQHAGTWVETAKAAGEALFGTDYDLFSIVILLVLGFGLLIGNISLTGDHWNGLIDVSVMLIIGARLAMYDLVFLILIAAICWVYISTKVWFRIMQ